jgi:GNAT superfamily N-acetyltransferase
MELKLCAGDADYDSARQITRDYIAWLNLDLSFQNLEREFADFAQVYGPPGGAYWLAFVGGALAGGAGLRSLEPGVCEMKRLYVYECFQRQGIGQALGRQLIATARQLGYARMRLDTVERLAAAIRLYERLGFRAIPAYCYNPDPTARFFELKL